MNTSDLTFNLLTFNHPKEEYTFYFTNQENNDLQRVYKNLVPDEVIEYFGEQDFYYTSFNIPFTDGFAVTQKTNLVFKEVKNENDKKINERNRKNTFKASILKRFYNSIIYKYFQKNNYIIKPNFIHDNEIWLSDINSQDENYNYYFKFTLKIQIALITKSPEILISFDGKSKVFKKSFIDLSSKIPSEKFNWVLYKDILKKYDKLSPDEAADYENIFIVWNFNIGKILNHKIEAPDKSNKYIKYNNQITSFINQHLNNDNFKSIIPINSNNFYTVDKKHIFKVNNDSNKLIFGNNYYSGNKHKDISPINGIKNGPFKPSPLKNVHFFFIMHKNDIDKANKIDNYFSGKEDYIKGFHKYTNTPYYKEPDFDIIFENENNPIPEIKKEINSRSFPPDINYIAIYISPFNKHIDNPEQKNIYYKIKELLLKKNILSQVLESEKILNYKVNYRYVLPNIYIAILAKLNGIPWQLDVKPFNELIVGIGAYNHEDINNQYIGSAFCFNVLGKFNNSDCFHSKKAEELAGSIINAVIDYTNKFKGIKRLIIHFYKDMSNKELDAIEKGLKELNLEIPVFIVRINKTFSKDIIAFDNSDPQLMPCSGTYINIGYNKYLLFNNNKYDKHYKNTKGFPFPIKLKISCNDKKLEKDTDTIKTLVNQVYQFSRIYWKSLTQQNLPITIKYPEMIAEIFPYFDGFEIPEFGKDKLWFL